jgi:CRP-like cAMP-binding protein
MNPAVKEKIEVFFGRYREMTYKRKDMLIAPGEILKDVFYIKEGYVREYAISHLGVELTLHMFTPDSFFPMGPVINNQPVTYFFEALSDVKVVRAPQVDVIEFLKSEPDVLFDLTSRIFSGLDKVLKRMENLVFHNALQRTVAALPFLVKHFGEKLDNKILVQEKFTHNDIANFAGISRETATRELSKLEKAGFIRQVNNRIEVMNMEELEKVVN